jgi:SAM-dependent methyltransferase
MCCPGAPPTVPFIETHLDEGRPNMATTAPITEPAGLAELKRRARATWAAGDFPEIARRALWPVGERIVQRVGIGKGERVLDIACGTGNAAIRAAQAGGQVVGLDLTPELFEAGRRLADEAGVSVEWVEGDAEAIPFEDERFDVVLSTFGSMFAPRHRVAAAEMARVLRPGGRLGLCNWTPEGLQGSFFRTMGAYAPAPPPFAQPPLLWGTEDHVRELFAGTGVQLEFDRDIVDEAEPFETGFEAVDFNAANFGPMIMLRPMLEARGEWEDLRARLAELYERHEPGEYLVVLGRKS